MKNVTLSIDDHVLDRARRLATERGTSVNQMIRDFLARETDTETEDEYRSRMELVELARNSHRGMTGPWSREEIYAERLSRHERPGLRGDRDVERWGEVEPGDGSDPGDQLRDLGAGNG
jgi:hypothetical protein